MSSSYYSVGYNCMGPLLLGFVQFVKNMYETLQCDEILFFARDGYVVEKAFKIVYPNLPSKYVYISRRSVTVPLLTEATSMSDILKTVTYVKRIETWNTFLYKLGIEDENIIQSLKNQYGTEVSKKELQSPNFADKVFNEIRESLFLNAQEEKKNLLNFFNFQNKNYLLVDIGWYGTMQDSLNKIYRGKNVSLYGAYLGLLTKDGADAENKFGYVYDCHRNKQHFDSQLIMGFNGLIETFFSAPYGSMKKYTFDGFELEEWGKESVNWSVVNLIHDGAIRYVKEKQSTEVFSYKESFYKLEQLFTNPTKDQIDLFKDIKFYDIYLEPLIKFKSWCFYIRNPKCLIRDFLSSNWKLGFIRKMFPKFISSKIVYKILLKLR